MGALKGGICPGTVGGRAALCQRASGRSGVLVQGFSHCKVHIITKDLIKVQIPDSVVLGQTWDSAFLTHPWDAGTAGPYFKQPDSRC